jgi:hypothetical protein
LRNNGVATLGRYYLYMASGTTLVNAGSFEFSNDASIYRYDYDDPAPVITNTGTLAKTGGDGTSYVDVPIDNTGTVHVASGELDVVGDGRSQTGAFSVDTGSTLGFVGGDFSFDGPAPVSGFGGIAVRGAHVTFTADVSFRRLTLSGGTIDGAGSLSIPSGGTFTWSSGTLDGASTTTVAAGATLDMSGCCYRYLLGGHTLRNDGTANLGGYYLYMASGTALVNAGSFGFSNDASIYRYDYDDPAPVITNTGTLAKTGGDGSSFVGVPVTNTGIVRVLTGTLHLDDGLSSLNSSTSTLRGLGYELAGTLEVRGGSSIATLAAPLSLKGSGGALKDSNGHNLLAGLTRITREAALAIQDGAQLQTTTALTNEGAVALSNGSSLTVGRGLTNLSAMSLGSRSTLTTNGTYLQSDGTTTLVDRTAKLVAAGDVVDLEGGVLTGSGTVGPVVLNRATVRPGNGIGTLDINGDFYQSPHGRLELDLGGPPPGGGFDQLRVSGFANPGGTLALVTKPDYSPEVGDEVVALSYAEENGEFAQVDGAEIGNGVAWSPRYHTNFASLVANAGQPPPAVSVSDVVVTEGNSGTATATFTVSLSSAVPAGGQVQVTFATADGTALAGSDYVALPPTTLTFTAGQTSKTVTVTVKGDTVVEPNETFLMNLTNPVGATLADSQGQGTIVNDDGSPSGPPLPSLTVSEAPVVEGNAAKKATFTLKLSAPVPSGKQVQVTYATADGTATAGSDYVALPPTTLTFAAGDSSKTVAVSVKGDTTPEDNETLMLNLTKPVGATLADSQGVATIVNDDLPPAVSVSDVVVTEGNSATATATFTVSLSSAVPAGGQVQVTFASADGTALAGSDYVALPPTTLTFTAGQTSKTVTVTVKGDTVVEPNETFLMNLTNPVGATLADSQGQGTIVDDD